MTVDEARLAFLLRRERQAVHRRPGPRRLNIATHDEARFVSRHETWVDFTPATCSTSSRPTPTG